MTALSDVSTLHPRQRQALKLKVRVERERRRRRQADPARQRPPLWHPNPDHADGRANTQRLAYESQADVIGLSGTAGWGKTQILLGLAANKHRHSVIFRRIFKNLRSTIEQSREIFNPDGRDTSKDSFNEQLHRWIFDGGKRMLEFEACQHEHNKYDQRGRPRSLMCFDEATEFSRSIVEFISGWNRSPDPGQKCQIVLAFNVPTDNAGTWVIDFFLPWIAFLFPHRFTHPSPAAPGELRWYATIDGKETECKDGVPFDHKGERVFPKSRTFFFGTLEDNPHYGDDYISTLQSMPEPLRGQLLYGNFAAESSADPWQVIPTAWVKLAQSRWLERERPSMPCSGVGVDVARGGGDKLVVARRYGTYFDEVTAVPGVNVEDGPKAAALVAQQLESEAHVGYINVDVVGVGTSAYDSLKVMYPGKVRPINAANGSDYIVASKGDKPGGAPLLKMRNVRAEYYWRMREALDPEHGVDISLPPGNEVVADLCAARWILQAGGVVQIEPKDKIKERIGRSPDVGEAIMFALAADYGVKGDDKTVSDWVAV